MIHKIGRIGVWSILFFIIGILLIPKIPLWYQIESLLEKRSIIIDQEQLADKGAYLSLKEGTLYFGNLEVALVSDAKLSFWLIRNSLTLEKLFFGKDLMMFQGITVDKATITHTLLSPLTLSLEAKGSFGTLDGEISFRDRQISIEVSPSKILEQKTVIMRLLTKTKEGYRYAGKF